MVALRRLTTGKTAVAITFIMLIAIAIRPPVDTDVWWHLRGGEYILSHGEVPRADPFSHTRLGQPWIDHSWLSQVLLYLIYSALGDTGLALYTAVLAVAAMFPVYALCRGDRYVRLFTLVLTASAAAIFWSPRPQMLSFLLGAVVLYLLHRYRERGRVNLFQIPILMALWANLHGGFTIGFILMVGVVAGEVAEHIWGTGVERMPGREVARLGLVLLISAMAVMLNPYGPTIYTYPLKVAGMEVLRERIEEWASPDFHRANVLPFAAMLLGQMVVLGLSRRRAAWTDLILTSGTALMALSAARNISLYAIVAAPVLSEHVSGLLDELGWRLPERLPSRSQALLNAVLILAVAMGVAAYSYSALRPESVAEMEGDVLPVAATEFLRDYPDDGPMFNLYRWGGYLMFNLPDRLVYVDGRTVLYGDDFLREYLAVISGAEGWDEVLDERGITLVIVDVERPLVSLLESSPEWEIAYEDDLAVISVRSGR